MAITLIVSAIISLIVTIINIGEKALWSKRSQWHYADEITKRVFVRDYSAQTLGRWLLGKMQEIKQHQPPYSLEQMNGLFKIAFLDFNDNRKMGEVVHQALLKDGIFADENVFTKPYFTYDSFLKHHSWFLEEVSKQRDIWLEALKPALENPEKVLQAKQNADKWAKRLLLVILGLLLFKIIKS